MRILCMASVLALCEKYSTDLAFFGGLLVWVGMLIAWPPAFNYSLGESLIWIGGGLFWIGVVKDGVLTLQRFTNRAHSQAD